jgi:putative transposase
MDEEYLIAAARYVELNPVKANMVETPQEYLWSSARHHLGLCEDALLVDSPMRSLIDDWHGLLMSGVQDQHDDIFRQSERSGRPVGSEAFLSDLECMLNRRLRKKKPGPKTRIK